MNLKKLIRILSKTKPILPSPEDQRFIRKMTNWQNSQWLRAGAVPEQAERFSNMCRRK